MNKRILLVEDDPAVASLIQKTLDEEQYEISVALDGQAGWDYISRFSYDIIILDVMMPHISGMELCKRARQQEIRTPILMLTALGSVDNIVMGLDAGADDYLTKPFRIAELLARVRSLLRRQPAPQPPSTGTPTSAAVLPTPPASSPQSQAAAGTPAVPAGTPAVPATPHQSPATPHQSPATPHQSPATAATLSFNDLILNLDEKIASFPGQSIDLTATEFRLLEYFLRNPRKVLSRMDILEKVWGYDFNMNTKVVDVYINYLRKKLETSGRPRLIQTVVGMGYILKDE